MSTAKRENYYFPRIFKGRRERTRHHKNVMLYQAIEPYLQVIWFQGDMLLKRKDNSS